MKTPNRSTLEEFMREAVPVYEARNVCPTCHSVGGFVLAHVSIHHAEFERCAGEGFVWPLHIPYCPRCEALPEDRGCLHLTPAQLMRYKLSRSSEQ